MLTDTHTLTSDYDVDEGKYYVWSKSEIEALIGVESAVEFCSVYNVTDEGNFEGENFLNLLEANQEDQEDDSSLLQSSGFIFLTSTNSILTSGNILLASRKKEHLPPGVTGYWSIGMVL